eukprot:606334-Hanusia_phi.AAC.4
MNVQWKTRLFVELRYDLPTEQRKTQPTRCRMHRLLAGRRIAAPGLHETGDPRLPALVLSSSLLDAIRFCLPIGSLSFSAGSPSTSAHATAPEPPSTSLPPLQCSEPRSSPAPPARDRGLGWKIGWKRAAGGSA